MPHTAYIVDAVRTAGGRRKGRIAHWHPADLGATVVDALVDRNGIDPAAIDDVIFGCVSQIGAQGGNIGRNVVLRWSKFGQWYQEANPGLNQLQASRVCPRNCR